MLQTGPSIYAEFILTLLKIVPAATQSDSMEEPQSLSEYNKHLSVIEPQIIVERHDVMTVK